MSRLLAAGLRGLKRLSQAKLRHVAGCEGTRTLSAAAGQGFVTEAFDFGREPFGPAWGFKSQLGDDGLPKEVNWLNAKWLGANGVVRGIGDNRQETRGIVKNQGHCGHCYIYSSLTSAEFLHFMMTGKTVRLSTQHVLDCHTLGNGGCYGGFPSTVLEYASRNGVLLESNYGFLGYRDVCKYMEADGVKVSGWMPVKPNCPASLKYAVAHQPVIVGVATDPVFKQYDTTVSSGRVVLEGRNHAITTLDHSTVIIGYGTTDEGIDFWLLLNSWGLGWAYRGLGYLSRDPTVVGAAGAYGMYRDPIISLKFDRSHLCRVKSRCESCPMCRHHFP